MIRQLIANFKYYVWKYLGLGKYADACKYKGCKYDTFEERIECCYCQDGKAFKRRQIDE